MTVSLERATGLLTLAGVLVLGFIFVDIRGRIVASPLRLAGQRIEHVSADGVKIITERYAGEEIPAWLGRHQEAIEKH